MIKYLSHLRKARQNVLLILALCDPMVLIFELAIKFFLLTRHLAVVIVDDFFGQLFQDIRFHSSHDEGHNFQVKFFQNLLLLVREQKLIFLESSQVDLE